MEEDFCHIAEKMTSACKDKAKRILLQKYCKSTAGLFGCVNYRILLVAAMENSTLCDTLENEQEAVKEKCNLDKPNPLFSNATT